MYWDRRFLTVEKFASGLVGKDHWPRGWQPRELRYHLSYSLALIGSSAIWRDIQGVMNFSPLRNSTLSTML